MTDLLKTYIENFSSSVCFQKTLPNNSGEKSSSNVNVNSFTEELFSSHIWKTQCKSKFGCKRKS